MSGAHVTTEAAAGQPGPAAAGFADLSAEAAALEGGPPVPGTPAADQAAAATIQENAAHILSALQMARAMVRPGFAWWHEFGEVWSDATLQGIAQSGAAIMERHGWTMGEVFEKWGPYFGLALSTGPAVFATWQAIKLQKARAQAAQRQGARPAEGAAGDGGSKAQD